MYLELIIILVEEKDFMILSFQANIYSILFGYIFKLRSFLDLIRLPRDGQKIYLKKLFLKLY